MHYSAERLLAEAKSFHLKKQLGQHFLVNPEALQKIVEALAATASDTIIEVGSGSGFLTRPLSESGARVVAVDLDRDSIARLKQLNLPNVELKHGDFLRFDLCTLAFADTKRGDAAPHTDAESNRSLKVAGNVPYQITGLILGHVLGEIGQPSPWLNRIEAVVLTVQKEVAQRMVAQPGSEDYSKLSLLIKYFCDATMVGVLQPSDFYPPPEVSSAVVKLIPRRQPIVNPKNKRLFKQIIDAGFRQRRKTLPNALSFLRIPAADFRSIFKGLSFDPQTRAERLSLMQFAMLADAIQDYLTRHAPNPSAGTGES